MSNWASFAMFASILASLRAPPRNLTDAATKCRIRLAGLVAVDATAKPIERVLTGTSANPQLILIKQHDEQLHHVEAFYHHVVTDRCIQYFTVRYPASPYFLVLVRARICQDADVQIVLFGSFPSSRRDEGQLTWMQIWENTLILQHDTRLPVVTLTCIGMYSTNVQLMQESIKEVVRTI